MLISSKIFSFGLNDTNNLASLRFDFGACKTGLDCAKQIILESFFYNYSFPIFKTFQFFLFLLQKYKLVQIVKKNISIKFLIMDMG